MRPQPKTRQSRIRKRLSTPPAAVSGADNIPTVAEAPPGVQDAASQDAASQDAAAGAAPDGAEANAAEPDAVKPRETLLQAAIRYAKIGLSLIRINERNKQPFGSWKEAQSTPASPQQVAGWPSHTGAFALACGAVSGGQDGGGSALFLTCIDIDVAEFHPLLEAQVGDLLARMPLQKTGGGFQLFFRSPLLVRNEKLAYAPDILEKTGRKIAIETRGQGGYAVIAPSSRRHRIRPAIATRGSAAIWRAFQP